MQTIVTYFVRQFLTREICRINSKLVHEGGFTIQRDYQNHWFFMRPDGRAVPACGYRANDMIDDDIGDVSELVNNPPAGGLLTGTDNFMSEPPPPAYWHQREARQ